MRQAIADDSLIGRQIAGYRIAGVLGAGGMGVVYLADHLRLERKVALKVLPPELTHATGYRDRFLRESRLAAGLDHPNVVPVHDAGEADGLLFIAMRRVEGRDLRSVLADGPLDCRRAVTLAGQVASALDAAHVRGLVHRDVKPANILVAESDHAYLTDFGIAVEFDASAPAATAPGDGLGTLAYVAPELADGRSVDGRADQYSLACVLYESLTGRPPFAGHSSSLALIWAHLEEPPPAVTDASPDLPGALDAVLARALAKEPADRFPSCEALVQAAAGALETAAAGALPSALDTASAPLLGRDEELQWLRAAWRGVREGPGAVILLSGARGAGKTRLAAELAREVHPGSPVSYASAVAAADAVRGGLAPSRTPALVIVEDLDAAADGLIDSLERAAREHRLLMIGTARDAGAPAVALLAARVPHLRLGPLSAEAIRAIGELYAGGEPLPLDAVAEASGGLPGAVHEVASEWARSAATRRLRDSAGRVAKGRSSLHAAEEAVSEDVQALQLVRERARIYMPELAPAQARRTPPFKGLASFKAEDVDWFFGRERLLGEMVARLAGARALCLVGASGSGKSSLLHAGLLPLLAGGAIPGSDRWAQRVLRPEELHGHDFAASPVDGRAFLVLDQFEEVFSPQRSDAERATILERVVAAATDPAGRFAVVLAIRADFYARCAEHPALAELLDRHAMLVGPMRREEMRRAIELPAMRAGVHVDPELTDVLVTDAAERPGALPLLSTTLLELWQARTGTVLTRADYERTGGVGGAVARLAESAFSELEEGDRDVARAVFLRLTQDTSEAGGSPVRRRAPLAEFDTDADERLRRVLSVLTAHRLVSVGEHGVEVAHEALLGEWPRLRTWLAEDAEGRRVRRELTDAARQWDTGGRDPGDLYRGARLAGTSEWAGHHEAELNALERDFVAASRAAAEADTHRIRRTNRRLRVLLAGIAVLLAAATAGGVVALVQGDRARDAETSALAERLGAQALLDEPLDRSVLLARQAVELEDSIQTRSSVLAALLRSPAALRVIPGNGNRLLRTAMSPDGRVLAVSDNTNSVLFVDARTFERAAPPLELPDQPAMAVFSADGRRLAVVYYADEGGVLQLFDAATRRPGPRRLLADNEPTGVTFSPDGRSLVVAYTARADGAPNRLVRLDARTLRRLSRPVRLPAGVVTAFHLGPGRLAVSWIDFNGRDRDGTTALFDARTLRRIRSMSPGSEIAAVDGRRTVALPTMENGIDLLDVRTGRVRPLEGRHEGFVAGMAFSPDGRTLASSGGDDGELILWDVASGQRRETLRGHSGRAFGPIFTRDGRTLFTAGLDSSIIAWDPIGTRRLGRSFQAGGSLPPDGGDPSLDPVVGRSGETLYVPTVDGKLGFWRARDLKEVRAPLDLGSPMDLAAAPGVEAMAASTSDGEIVLLDPSGRITARRRVTAPTPGPPEVVYRADGRLLALATERGVLLLDGATARRQGAPLPVVAPVSVAFSPDGDRLAVGTNDGHVEVWSVAERRRLYRHATSRYTVFGIAYAPDGSLIATGGDDGYLRLLDAGTGRPAGAPVRAHDGFVIRTGFSPDGNMVYSAGTDSAVSLWDVRTRKQIGAPLPVGDGWAFAAFSDDGSSLLTTSQTGRAVLWSVDPADWERRACELAGRTLTRAEWGDFLPERSYAPACR